MNGASDRPTDGERSTSPPNRGWFDRFAVDTGSKSGRRRNSTGSKELKLTAPRRRSLPSGGVDVAEVHEAMESPFSPSQGDGNEGILGGSLGSRSSFSAIPAVRGGGIDDDDNGCNNDDGDDRQNDEAHEIKDLPPRTLIRTTSHVSLDLPPIKEGDGGANEEVPGELHPTLSTHARETLARVQLERGKMLEPLFERILKDGLAVDTDAIYALWFDAQDPPLWQTVDVEQHVARRIEALRRELEHPARGVALAPREVGDRVVAQMRDMAAEIEGVMADAVATHIARDTQFTQEIITGLTRKLQAPQPASSSTQAMDSFTTQQTPSSGRQSRLTMLSTMSGPESINQGFDRTELLSRPRLELVDIIMSQEKFQTELEREVDDDHVRDEEEIHRLETREMELTQKNEEAAREIREVRKTVSIAHENGLKGLKIDGSGPATPRIDGGRGRRSQKLDVECARDGSPSSPVGTEGEEGGNVAPARPFHRCGVPDSPADSGTHPPDVAEDGMGQNFDEFQTLMVALEEEDVLSSQYVSHLRHQALQATLDAEVVSAAAAVSGATPGDEAPASSRTSATSFDGMAGHQLQTQLLMAEEDRDGDDALDNLPPSGRQRGADVSEQSMKIISGFIPQFTRCSQTASVFAQTMIDVGRVNRGEGIEQVQDALRIILDDEAYIKYSEPTTYEQQPGVDYGKFAPNEQFQRQWLPRLQVFLSNFIELFEHLEVLNSLIDTWDYANPRNEQGQMLEDLQSEGSQRYSTSSGNSQTLLSRAASNISSLVFGSEQDLPGGGPLFTIPEWARLHPDHEPCPDCRPVLRFPADFFQGAADPGLCNCGHAAILDPRFATVMSRHSASRVSSVDFGKPLASANGAVSPRSTRSILRKFPRGPMRLDIELANAGAGSDVSTRTGTSHPSTISSAGRLAADARWASAPGITSAQDGAVPSPADRFFVKSPSMYRHDISMSTAIIQPRNPCCTHYHEGSQLCDCHGKCEDHWCCDHWEDTVGCGCDGVCEEHQCCQHGHLGRGKESCGCVSSCADHRCCSCGVIDQANGTAPCQCGGTCRNHAVCDHYAPDNLDLACMAGCPGLQDEGTGDHPDAPLKGGTTISWCRQPCKSHPCCEHWTVKDGRPYCECGKRCDVHRCCKDYNMSSRVCDCGGICEAHVPLELRERRRNGGFPDWARTTQEEDKMMRALGVLDVNGNVIPEKGRSLLARRRQGRLSQGSGLGIFPPATMDAPAARGCSCRCRAGGMQNILTAGGGSRFAFFVCRRMPGYEDLASSEHFAPRGEDDLVFEAPLGIGVADPAMPPTSRSSRRAVSSSASSMFRMSRTCQASRAPSDATPPSDRPTQDVAQSPICGFENPPGAPAVSLTRRHSDRLPQSPRQSPPQTPCSLAGLDHADEYVQDGAARKEDGEGGIENDEDDMEPPGAMPQNDQYQDEQQDESPDGSQANEPPVAEIQRVEGQLGNGVPGPQRPSGPEPELEVQLQDPRVQLIWLIWKMLRFLTWGQVYNMWMIVLYLVGLVYYAGRRNVDRFRRLRGQGALRAWAPVLPTTEIFQVALWAMMVWFSVLMIAITEERRLWLAANPRTATYMRGLRHRKPYPRWSPFEVDYALLDPGIDWLSVWLHRAVFRPGLESMLGLETNRLAEVVGNPTWLAWAGVLLVAVM